jgi:ArsR family transcriptional regulator, arsenate/arsenite/antimonite-responsive transcriptional repressor
MVGIIVKTISAPARDDVERRVALLKAVADPTRLQVLEQLEIAGPRCHCELEEALDVPANRMSFHLRVLRDVGLVVTERQGKRVAYRLDVTGLARLRRALPGTGDAPGEAGS